MSTTTADVTSTEVALPTIDARMRKCVEDKVSRDMHDAAVKAGKDAIAAYNEELTKAYAVANAFCRRVGAVQTKSAPMSTKPSWRKTPVTGSISRRGVLPARPSRRR